MRLPGAVAVALARLSRQPDVARADAQRRAMRHAGADWGRACRQLIGTPPSAPAAMR